MCYYKIEELTIFPCSDAEHITAVYKGKGWGMCRFGGIIFCLFIEYWFCTSRFCCPVTFYLGNSTSIHIHHKKKKIISGLPDVNLELPDTEMTLHRLFLACHSEHNSVQPEGMPHQGLILWCEITVLRELNYRSFFELLYLYIFFALSCFVQFCWRVCMWGMLLSRQADKLTLSR